MKYKSIIVVVIFILLTSIFAMSDDGGSEPAVAKKEVISEVSQVGNLNTTEETKPIDTVKDCSGIDTGMTQKELEIFKTQYIKRAEELKKQDYNFISPESYFEHKVNLNNIDKLMELGFFVTKNEQGYEIEYSSIIEADIIIIGTIDHLEYLYETDEEERNARKTYKDLTRYYVKVKSLLKGSEYYNSIPEEVTYTTPFGKNVWVSSDYKLEIGQKYILFFRKYMNTNDDLSKIRATSLRLEEDGVYLEHFDGKLDLVIPELLSKISKFQEINDTENFYNRYYLNAGEEE